jgi:hypothetical protein
MDFTWCRHYDVAKKANRTKARKSKGEKFYFVLGDCLLRLVFKLLQECHTQSTKRDRKWHIKAIMDAEKLMVLVLSEKNYPPCTTMGFLHY